MVALPVRTVVQGNPVSSTHQIDPILLTELLEEMQAQAALNGALFFEDALANLNGTSPADGDTGFVLDDGTASNNGVYQYQVSAWVKTSELPAGFSDALSAKADVAALDAELATVAKTGAYGDLSGLPTLGTAAASAKGEFATSAQGGKADTAVQPADLAAYASGATVSALVAETPHSPGLIRWRYGYGTNDSILNGAPEVLPEAPQGLVETVTGRGRIIRLDAADALLADRSLITLTPESVTEVFATFRRNADTTDPANDTVRVAIRWLDASFAAVGDDEILDDIELTVSMGDWRTAALVSRESDLGADIVAPAGAAYGRLYLKAFGANGETDVELMGHQDATRVAALLQLIS